MIVTAMLLLASVSQYGSTFNEDGLYLPFSHMEHGQVGCLAVVWNYMPSSFSIELCKDFFAIETIATSISVEEYGSGSWVYPTYIPISWGSGSGYRLRLYDWYGNEKWSDEFSISNNSSIGISQDSWAQGMNDAGIQWSGFGSNIYVALEFPDGTSYFIDQFTGGLGSAHIEVADWMGLGSGYRLLASDEYGNTATSSRFSIQPVNVTSPSTWSSWARGEIHPTITWSGSGAEANVTLLRNGRLVTSLSDGWVPNKGELRPSVTIPETWPGGSIYTVEVSLRDQSQTVVRGSSRTFSIEYSDNEIEGPVTLSTIHASGCIDYSDDIDRWRFRASEHTLHRFEVSGASEYRLSITSNTGEPITVDTGRSISFTSDSTTWYHLCIRDNPEHTALGDYEISRSIRTEHERHRTYGGVLGMTGTATDSNTYVGFEFRFVLSPIRYIECNVSGHTLTAEQTYTYGFLSSYIGLRTPRLAGISLLAGAAYDLRVSRPDDLWFQEGRIVEDARFDSGIRSFIGLLVRTGGDPYTGSLYGIRAGAYFNDAWDLARISVGFEVMD